MLEHYLREIRRHKMLPKDADKTASRDELIHSSLRLVVHIARKYAKNEDDLMDLIQDGNIGLVKAADKYDPAKGSFTKYAYFLIRQQIRESRRDELGRLIHLKKTGLPVTCDVEEVDLSYKDKVSHIDIAKMMKPLSQRESYCIDGYLKGFSANEMSVYVGVSKCRIEQNMRRALQKMTEYAR